MLLFISYFNTYLILKVKVKFQLKKQIYRQRYRRSQTPVSHSRKERSVIVCTTIEHTGARVDGYTVC